MDWNIKNFTAFVHKYYAEKEKESKKLKKKISNLKKEFLL